jgi:clan AA aspartic protease
MMISGRVTDNLDAVITLTVRDVSGNEITVEAIVDTGFNGFLTIPPSHAVRLGLTPHDQARALLADGSMVTIRSYRVPLVWQGADRVVIAEEIDGAPLVGMELMRDNVLTIHVNPNGALTIEPEP